MLTLQIKVRSERLTETCFCSISIPLISSARGYTGVNPADRRSTCKASRSSTSISTGPMTATSMATVACTRLSLSHLSRENHFRRMKSVMFLRHSLLQPMKIICSLLEFCRQGADRRNPTPTLSSSSKRNRVQVSTIITAKMRRSNCWDQGPCFRTKIRFFWSQMKASYHSLTSQSSRPLPSTSNKILT